VHNNVFKNCVGGLRFLAVKDGKNAQDLKGNVRPTQAGKNLYIYRNQFLGYMAKDAIRIQSYNNIKHNRVLIAQNDFGYSSQTLYLKDIQNLHLSSQGNIKVKKVNVKSI